MATFCETLAETGLVVDACLAAGKSTVSAYALRRRNALFAAAWEGALTIARERLADTLLARSIEGSVEQYYRDGELVGERKLVDNRWPRHPPPPRPPRRDRLPPPFFVPRRRPGPRAAGTAASQRPGFRPSPENLRLGPRSVRHAQR